MAATLEGTQRHFTLCFQMRGDFHASKNGEPPIYSAAMQRLAQTFEDKLMRENDTCIHASSEYDIIRETFGQRIKTLQYRYERDGHKLGGIHVLGGNRRLNPILIFGDKA